jgi:hypothetical protein
MFPFPLKKKGGGKGDFHFLYKFFCIVVCVFFGPLERENFNIIFIEKEREHDSINIINIKSIIIISS